MELDILFYIVGIILFIILWGSNHMLKAIDKEDYKVQKNSKKNSIIEQTKFASIFMLLGMTIFLITKTQISDGNFDIGTKSSIKNQQIVEKYFGEEFVTKQILGKEGIITSIYWFLLMTGFLLIYWIYIYDLENEYLPVRMLDVLYFTLVFIISAFFMQYQIEKQKTTFSVTLLWFFIFTSIYTAIFMGNAIVILFGKDFKFSLIKKIKSLIIRWKNLIE